MKLKLASGVRTWNCAGPRTASTLPPKRTRVRSAKLVVEVQTPPTTLGDRGYPTATGIHQTP
eukprot:1862333-Alexandrium_andersonii.AAC.1